ncbi:Hpt domain-containing protein [Sinisalibacter aestuarii]|uniref:HPt domain-containing protein n=1 Tax=Sinisalibacter aestuarii TaxID=2949426 RepID=A0ABQ5LQS8_9RHOB|nr:Hpt domain-containing protein [Sinisalibacter aestuarii]GKY87364.1 hypothetical protein STA1M1_12330 [Sinisalibacter aestuarii]
MINSQETAASHLAAALAEIRARFINDLIPLINEMEYQRVAMTDPALAPEAFSSLQHASHKISGMAGSVGFPELGDHAARLDVTFTKLLRAPYDHAGVQAALDPLEAFLSLMEDILDEVL